MDSDDQLTIQHLASELRDVAKEMHAMKRLATVGMWAAGFVIVSLVSLGAYIVTSVIQHNLMIANIQSDLENHQDSATPHPVQLLSQAQLFSELALIKQELTNLKTAQQQATATRR